VYFHFTVFQKEKGNKQRGKPSPASRLDLLTAMNFVWPML